MQKSHRNRTNRREIIANVAATSMRCDDGDNATCREDNNEASIPKLVETSRVEPSELVRYSRKQETGKAYGFEKEDHDESDKFGKDEDSKGDSSSGSHTPKNWSQAGAEEQGNKHQNHEVQADETVIHFSGEKWW